MQVYKGVKDTTVIKNETVKNTVFSQKKLRIFSVIFLMILTSGMLGLSISQFGISTEVRTITSSWAPNVTDLGKLKFVDTKDYDLEAEAFASLASMQMPFDNSYTTIDTSGSFNVNGLGGLIVKSCLEGKVSKIENKGNYKCITVSHGKGLVSIYDNLDNVSVKEGNVIDKNAPLGISLASQIKLTVLFKDKIIAGLTVQDGEMTFM